MTSSFFECSNYSLLVVRNGHCVTDAFIQFNIYLTFITVTFGNNSSGNCLWVLVSLHHHVLEHVNHLLLVHGGISSSIPLWFPAILGHVFLLVTVITAKFSLPSSAITALSLGFLRHSLFTQVPGVVLWFSWWSLLLCKLRISHLLLQLFPLYNLRAGMITDICTPDLSLLRVLGVLQEWYMVIPALLDQRFSQFSQCFLIFSLSFYT